MITVSKRGKHGKIHDFHKVNSWRRMNIIGLTWFKMNLTDVFVPFVLKSCHFHSVAIQCNLERCPWIYYCELRDKLMNNFRVRGCLVTLVPCTVWIIENTKTFGLVQFLKIPSCAHNVSTLEKSNEPSKEGNALVMMHDL